MHLFQSVAVVLTKGLVGRGVGGGGDECSTTIVLKLWSTDQQHQHHQRAY